VQLEQCVRSESVLMNSIRSVKEYRNRKELELSTSVMMRMIKVVLKLECVCASHVPSRSLSFVIACFVLRPRLVVVMMTLDIVSSDCRNMKFVLFEGEGRLELRVASRERMFNIDFSAAEPKCQEVTNDLTTTCVCEARG
jgi:hypothetical protein